MKQLLYTTGVKEVIFCINGLSYRQVIDQIQHCGAAYEYKIHLPGSQSFVGSNSSSTSGDLYTIDRRFNLTNFAHLRNKRLLDIGLALIFLLSFPVTFFIVRHPAIFFINCFKVISGHLTWVGYASGIVTASLPPIRRGVLQPYNVLEGYEPSPAVKTQINTAYAQSYTPINDITLLLKNFSYLGG